MINKKTKEESMAQQQMIHLLVNIIQMFGQYTVSQHLTHILRKKNEKKEVYDWNDTFLLSIIEKYYDELQNDLITQETED